MTSGAAHRRSPKAEDLSAAEVAEAALDHVASLTGKETAGVTAIMPTDKGWDVEVEVVEDTRIPSTSDIMALYEAHLDALGDLLSYRRIRRYVRGRGDPPPSGS